MKKDSKNNVQEALRMNKKTYYDKLMDSVVEYSNNSKTDTANKYIFNAILNKSEQDEFKQNLKNQTYSKMEILQRENILKNEVVKDIKGNKVPDKVNTKAVEKTIENKTAGLNDPAIEGVTNKYEMQEDEKSLKSEVLKAIYVVMQERYNYLKSEVNRELKRDDELTPNKKIYNEYLAYEGYIRKVDETFKVLNGRYIVLDDKDIKKKDDNLDKKTTKSEIYKKSNISVTLDEVDKINESIDKDYDKILTLNDKYINGLMDEELYNEKLSGYAESIAKKKVDIDRLNPSLKEISEYSEQNEKYKEAKYRLVGDKREKQIEKKSAPFKGETKLDGIDENIEEKIEDNEDNFKKEIRQVNDEDKTTEAYAERIEKEAAKDLNDSRKEEIKNKIEEPKIR